MDINAATMEGIVSKCKLPRSFQQHAIFAEPTVWQNFEATYHQILKGLGLDEATFLCTDDLYLAKFRHKDGKRA
jgi:hypothetical protein